MTHRATTISTAFLIACLYLSGCAINRNVTVADTKFVGSTQEMEKVRKVQWIRTERGFSLMDYDLVVVPEVHTLGRAKNDISGTEYGEYLRDQVIKNLSKKMRVSREAGSASSGNKILFLQMALLGQNHQRQ